jgi:hypothetical protein
VIFVSTIHKCPGTEGKPCGVITQNRLCYYCLRTEELSRPVVREIAPKVKK